MHLVEWMTAASQGNGVALDAKTRVLIIGTHPRTGWALWRVEADGVQAAGMADGMSSSLGLCESLAADVVVIDGSLDAERLAALAAALRERHRDKTILVITDTKLVEEREDGGTSRLRGRARLETTTTFTDRLTGREQQVTNLLRSGGSVSQIAGLLRMNVTTAKSSVSRIYHKLGASDRALVLMAAVDHGITEVALAAAG